MDDPQTPEPAATPAANPAVTVLDITRLQQRLRQFAAERDWEPFHAPKNLAMALTVEAAELAEIFQWMEPEASRAAHADHLVQEQIGDELSDVLLYLLQLADHCAVDLDRAVERKLEKNARKHPPKRLGAVAAPAVRAPEPVHVLVDWENVQPRDEEILARVPGATHAWIFHGRTQRRVDADQAAFGENLTLIPISRSGKNALDFHLALYLGYIASRNPRARIVVVSNDQGYGPMLEHARALGFDASQVGFQRQSAARRTGRGRAAPSGEKAPAASRRRSTAKAAAALPKVAADAAAEKPSGTASRRRRSRAQVDAAALSAGMPEAVVAPIAADAQEARAPEAEVPASEVTQRPAAKRAAKTGSTQTRRKRSAAAASEGEATAAVAATAPPESTSPEAPTAPTAPAKRAAGSSARDEGPDAPPAAKRSRRKARSAPEPVLFSEDEYAHVRSTLGKNRDKPGRRNRLLSLVRSLLDGGKAEAAKVEAVVARLVADGVLQISAEGAVSTP